MNEYPEVTTATCQVARMAYNCIPRWWWSRGLLSSVAWSWMGKRSRHWKTALLSTIAGRSFSPQGYTLKESFPNFSIVEQPSYYCSLLYTSTKHHETWMHTYIYSFIHLFIYSFNYASYIHNVHTCTKTWSVTLCAQGSVCIYTYTINKYVTHIWSVVHTWMILIMRYNRYLITTAIFLPLGRGRLKETVGVQIFSLAVFCLLMVVFMWEFVLWRG